MYFDKLKFKSTENSRKKIPEIFKQDILDHFTTKYGQLF